MIFYNGLDSDSNVCPFLDQISSWASFVLRYSKNLSSREKILIENAGLSLGIVFETRTDNSLGGAQKGIADAKLFLARMNVLNIKPKSKSACFVTTDLDTGALSSIQLKAILDYYKAFSDEIGGNAGWQIGGYSCGQLQNMLISLFKDRTYYPWSVGAKAWKETTQFDIGGNWIISQGPENANSWPKDGTLNMKSEDGLVLVPSMDWPKIDGFGYDPDVAINMDWAV